MSFDRLAPHYRWMECVLAGSKLQRCRTAFIDNVSVARRALLLGEGNGRFLVELFRARPDIHVTCVDASSAMLARALRMSSCGFSRAISVVASGVRSTGT